MLEKAGPEERYRWKDWTQLWTRGAEAERLALGSPTAGCTVAPPCSTSALEEQLSGKRRRPWRTPGTSYASSRSSGCARLTEAQNGITALRVEGSVGAQEIVLCQPVASDVLNRITIGDLEVEKAQVGRRQSI